MVERHLEKLSGSIIYEKTEDDKMLEVKNLERLSKEELIELLQKKEESVKRTTMSGNSNYDYDRKFITLKNQYPHLSDNAIKHLVFLKDSRKFIVENNEITLEKTEECW